MILASPCPNAPIARLCRFAPCASSFFGMTLKVTDRPSCCQVRVGAW
ncbi:MAG: hypothetical protein JWQ45_645 [Blastococcus sp.]|nr:hypothetical protein [Blastococcus sp.]